MQIAKIAPYSYTKQAARLNPPQPRRGDDKTTIGFMVLALWLGLMLINEIMKL